MINKSKLKGNLLLLLTAFIWGSTFVAQSEGMAYVGPLTYQSVRSIIGAIVLIPVIFLMDFLRKKDGTFKPTTKEGKKTLWIGGVCCGIIICVASTLQQYGINLGCDSGKAGFITACYILLVPVIGLFFRKKVSPIIWLCIAVSLVGLYLLCIKATGNTSFFNGLPLSDLLVILCAVVFSFHIVVIDHFSPLVDGVRMSAIQFMVSGVLAGIFMFIFEQPTFSAIFSAWGPILYAGVLSCGVAYTLQILAQRDTDPTVASMLMSLESVFAVLATIAVKGTLPNSYEWIGCGLMFIAIIVAQLPWDKYFKKSK